MSAPPVEPEAARQLVHVVQRINAAYADLQGARSAYAYSPNHETQKAALWAEDSLNRWLDELPR